MFMHVVKEWGQYLWYLIQNNMLETGGTNIVLIRPAYSYSIVLIVFVLEALINLYVRSEY